MAEFNKEIQKLKLALTSDCVLRCAHCFIDKSAGLTLRFADAARAVDLFLGSPGDYKRLELYGGEPFLRYDLLKRIVAYARRVNKKAGKRLFITAATSAVPLDEAKLAWLRANGVGLAISFSGGRATHDHTRVFPGGAGSYAVVSKKCALAVRALEGSSLVALLCVHPARAAGVYEDFRKVLAAGFRTVDIECVHGHGWDEKSFRLFKTGFDKVLRRVDAGIHSGDPVFLENFIELLVCTARGKFACPVYRDLEMYPDGSYSLYPFGFVDGAADAARVRIGSGAKGLKKKFLACSYPSRACRGCAGDYYVLDRLRDGHAPYTYRTASSELFFKGVLEKTASDRRYLGYVREIRTMREAAYLR
ncbi:MAG TPA: hypothetical protein DCW72_10890 [Elusimicrobia bacterium]|nr:MAG: hypothetical protein A2X29_10295 [Elusimicrobia bacterium GWA2_64_40]HAN04488.1 hypothetical protein [Elusimicrobiota bacterium]HAU90683.1 hypothetical protein [Elusimicrobiota bacterium]